MANAIKMFGAYVGVGVDPKVDFDNLGQKLSQAGYTAISIFLTTAFNNVDLWPWTRSGTKFDFSTINPAWKSHIQRCCDTLAKFNVNPHFCFVDQFHDSGDSPGADPFRQALGSAWDEEPLYSSWDGSKYTWLAWDPNKDPKPGHIEDFKVLPGFGQGMQRYIKAVIACCKKTRTQFPTFTPTWKWGNETLARFDPVQGKTTNQRGDRDEVYIWVRCLWEQAGFVEGDSMRSYFDYLCVTAGKHKTDPDYINMPTMKSAFTKGVRGKHKANMEIHGILTLADIQKFNAAGLDEDFLLFSTDGDLGMKADYPGLGKSPFHTDLKFDIKKGQTWDSQDWMKNFNKYWPGKYDRYVKSV